LIIFFLFLLSVFSLFPGISNAQNDISRDSGEKKDKKEHQFYIGINFPGFGFSHYKMEGNNIFYFDKASQQNISVQGPFNGNAMNVIYGLEAMLPIKRFKIGASIFQEYIHVLKFYNKNIHDYASPLFAYYEQVHFQKFGMQLEYIFRKRKFSSIAVCVNGSYIFPDKVYVQKYVKDRIDLGGGILFSWFLSNRTQFIFRPFFEYISFTNLVRQTDTHKISFSQDSPDKSLSNNIYSFNCYIGFRINLFKVRGLPVRSPRFAN
jgi:hypothetical protein